MRSTGCTYLDHAGATLAATSQLARAFEELSAGAFGNPHSQLGLVPPEHSTAGGIARVRRQALRFFRASEDEYELVFTSGATAALKLVGECFPWTGDSVFAHAVDSHTSVLGIRGYAEKQGAAISCVGLDELEGLEHPSRGSCDGQPEIRSHPASLFAFPAECNFSGTMHDLLIIDSVHRGEWNPPGTAPDAAKKWFVLVDAAKYVSTHPLDLSVHHPDFVVMSFYKMFGYPTGLGALIVRKTALPYLQKTYYGGGAVKSILATRNFVVPRDTTGANASSAAFADGTESFLSIMSLRHGFEQLERLQMKRIEEHTATLTRLLTAQLQATMHWSGRPVCKLYGDFGINARRRGSIVSCNFLRADGSYVGYAEVNKLADIHNIRLRTGCFCNPGACQEYLGLSDDDLRANIEAGHVCGDDVDILNGLPTGAVRFSIGYMTTFEDIAALLEFVDTYFVSRAPPTPHQVDVSSKTRAQGVFLRKISLFPIKSCAGMAVDSWPVGSRGLLFDREWAIVDAASGSALSLKDTPKLCFIRPFVDLKRQTLTLSYSDGSSVADTDSLTMPLNGDSMSDWSKIAGDRTPRNIRVCAGACKANDASDAASAWISELLDRQCSLVRVSSNHLRKSTANKPRRQAMGAVSEPNPADESQMSPKKPAIGFANQAQYLMISRQSVDSLNSVLRSSSASLDAMQVHEDAFRANFVVDGCDEPFAEDDWTRLRIGDAEFDVSGRCSRCSVINVDQQTGAFDRRPLQALSSFRRERSSIFFGQYLTRRGGGFVASEAIAEAAGDGGIVWLRVLDPVVVEVGRV